MTRITKDPEDRKQEIMSAAMELFHRHGYKKTSVEKIITEVNIAKGTFYYYFKSKEHLLEQIASKILDDMVQQAEFVANNPSLSALEKLNIVFSKSNDPNKQADGINESLHLVENRELHEEINVQIVLKLSIPISKIVMQGLNEKVFDVENPTETVQFLLGASQFFLEKSLFNWTAEEERVRLKVMQNVAERALGAKKGTFKFIN